MSQKSLFFRIFFIILGVVVLLSVTGYVLGWFGEAASVAQDEFGPKASLEKYEWFIDQASRIDKMDRDILLFENRAKNVSSKYHGYGSDMVKWPPHIQTQYNNEKQQADEDLMAIVSQRNGLAQEYNAASNKFNWAPFKTESRKPKENYVEYMIQ